MAHTIAVNLTDTSRHQIESISRSTTNRRVSRRAEAILRLDRGEDTLTVAEALGVGRSTVYGWVRRFNRRSDLPLIDRLRDRPHTGRPPVKRLLAQDALEGIVELLPGRSKGTTKVMPVWVVSACQAAIRQERRVDVSERTVQRALKRLGIRRSDRTVD